MGYSARYHAASLAAVLLALAIGILIGAGIGGDVLTGTAENLERSLESDLEEAREREDELSGELEREQTLAARVYPAVVANRLRGETVGVVAVGGLPENLAREIEATIEPTGARLAKVAVVRQPPDLGALSERLGGRFDALESNPGQVERLGRKLGKQLVRGGDLVGRAREQLLERVSGDPDRVDNVIVYAPPPADAADAGEGDGSGSGGGGGEDDGALDESEAAEHYESGILDGIRNAGEPSVGVELRSTDPSAIGTYQSRDIPSSDSLELTSGKLAAVFALLGADGNFGVKESADALLPEVVPQPRGRGRGSGDEAGSEEG